MKMMSSTSTTSTSGVTLMSERAWPAPTTLFRWVWIFGRRRLRGRGAVALTVSSSVKFQPSSVGAMVDLLPRPTFAQDVADELGGDVVHVDDERLDGVGEVVERHDRRDG